MIDLEKRLLALQQKIESLHVEVATLVALTTDSAQLNNTLTDVNEAKPLANRPLMRAEEAPVGINRFRQLATESV